MAAFDYTGLLARVVRILRTDDRVSAIAATVTDEPDYPTAEQCPAIQVAMVGFSRRRVRMVARSAAGQPYDETIQLAMRCVAFSGHGAADARRQRDELVRAVEQALDDAATLEDTVQLCDVRPGPVGARTADDGSMCAEMTLQLEVQVRS